MRLDLHQDLSGLVDLRIAPGLRVGLESATVSADNDGGIVFVSRQDAVRRMTSRVANHFEERGVAWLSVDRPVGIEDLVTAVFRVDLGESKDFAVCQFSFLIRDNGVGMNEEIRKQLFTRFFSTKDAGGTGLGLCVTHKIVEEHGGAIEVESSPGHGSIFTIVLKGVYPENQAGETSKQ